jgi:hypothetical protein
VHEVERPLPVVEGLPPLLLPGVGLGNPQPVQGEAERGGNGEEARDE